MFQKRLSRMLGVSHSVAVAAPVSGRLIPLREVKDEVFSRGFMGEGVAIDPSDGYVVAPISGKVTHVIDTKHALVIEHSTGLQFLIHIGIDTVDLKGEGFLVLVKAGDTLLEGQVIMKFDLHNIRKAGYPAFVLITAIGERLIDYVECEYREVHMAEPDVFRIVLK
ncbi:PTS sugar transporter subunit IIA [Cohnella abietis]|uniref:PTS EIIA type-1 domain-containing protein n=1 Tax=Cohnella abietis TaxID=2507935 RepID=A0A3T1DCK5_9BACL|nr:PTS glucose transporter subunit IIA [Cohnella abietis]BBI35832.1 hypothetical protein KCTCHS21_52310 [Cohnella abietis]